MKRRNVIKGLTMLPFAGSLLPLQSFASPAGVAEGLEAATGAGPLEIGPRIFQSIGIEPIINCRGTFTIIGGSLERPEVRAAMEATSEIRAHLSLFQRSGAPGKFQTIKGPLSHLV